MNQRGEITLFCIMILVTLSGLMLLCTLELQSAYSLLFKRSQLFLCTKEIKGEVNKHLKFMGKTNWGIKNVQRASLIMMFVPGLQGMAINVRKVKKALMTAQDINLVSYLKTITAISHKGCPIDQRILITPFELKSSGHARDSNGVAKLRSKNWNYSFVMHPYSLNLKINGES